MKSQDSISGFKTHVYDLIATGNERRAVSELLAWIRRNSHSKETFYALVRVSNNFYRLEQQYQRGEMQYFDYQIHVNKLLYQLCYWTDEIMPEVA